MAYIEYVGRTSNSITVHLKGLSGGYNESLSTNGVRTAYWYVSTSSSNYYQALKTSQSLASQYLTSDQTQPTDACKITGLSPSTSYYITCVIKKAYQNTTLAELHYLNSNGVITPIWTADPTPTINSFTVTQTATGEKRARCTWNVSNYVSGITEYAITVNGYPKKSGTITSSSGSTTISFDNFQTYTVEFEVWTNEEYDYAYADVDIVEDDVLQGEIDIVELGGCRVDLKLINLNSSQIESWLGEDYSTMARFYISESPNPNSNNYSAYDYTYIGNGVTESSVREIYGGISPNTTYYCAVEIYINVGYDEEYEPGDLVGTLRTQFTTKSANLTPYNIFIRYRRYSQIYIEWYRSFDAYGSNFQVVRAYNRDDIVYSRNKTFYISFETKYWVDENGDAAYGVTYIARIQSYCYDEEHTSDWVEYKFTTNPSEPTISLSQVSNKIKVNYGVKYKTNASRIQFDLYSSDTGEHKETQIVTIGYLDQTPSGTVTFNTSCSPGEYYVRAFTELDVDDNDDGVYETLQSMVTNTINYVEASITISGEIPEPWYWTTDISPTSIIPLDSKGFHPVTAEEWNGFVDRMREVKTCLEGYNMDFSHVSLDNISPVGQYADFTVDIYNLVAEASIGLGIYCEKPNQYNVTTIDYTTPLSASLFTSLKDQINYIIGEI